MEKGRLGQEACRALSQRSEQEKAVVMQDAVRKAEDVWRQSQRALLEQAQKAKQQIDSQAQNRISDIEREARQAVGRVYISPNSPMGGMPPQSPGAMNPGSFRDGFAGNYPGYNMQEVGYGGPGGPGARGGPQI